MIYAYVRISKDTSDTENQVAEIERYVETHQLPAPQYLREIVSGAKSANSRELAPFIDKMREGDLLIVSALSRLGRDVFDVMATLKTLIDKRVRVITIQENREFSNNLESQMFAAFYSLFAAIERDFIIQRTRASIARQKEEGSYFGGRPKGAIKELTKRQFQELEKQLKKGEYRKHILSQLLDISRPTFNLFLKNNPEWEEMRRKNQPSRKQNL